MKWIIFSFSALFCNVIYVLLLKNIFNNITDNIIGFIGITSITFIGLLISSIFISNMNIKNIVKELSVIKFIKILSIILLALSSFLFTCLGIKNSPNPGYVLGITSIGALICSICAKYFFNESLDFSKLIGLIIIFIGTILLIK